MYMYDYELLSHALHSVSNVCTRYLDNLHDKGSAQVDCNTGISNS
jgi:hypothetical protein